MDAKIRLYVDHPLGAGQSVPLDRGQAHYLFGVMRQQVGAAVLLFNGRDGEWRATVTQAGKRGGELSVTDQSGPQRMPPDLWLCFAPIKKARTDFIVEKAAEMGAARIIPMQTEFTNAGRVQRDRLQAHAIEAAEQCGGTFVPQVDEMVRFDRLLDEWSGNRHIMFCDEALHDVPVTPLAGEPAPWAIFIGPEGGFSARERDRLRALDLAVPVSLGPRILRADTAAVAALTLWQSALGDWS
ncbi:16S rRNA (uracil(1498)-N(3))-methyltransferase [Sulfitobacter sp. S190]|uniref:16S rRNA (uracil(1498)-N(3))-methyltransferase n=1 Tax=Sulfitobacter sp. S190 TaxID=2867022 RepID=UPI0021A4E099|nr:16S rRNA (uracil(1498)-N(3))-methyltransferase [Sulfitobacter sp. S190]UWR23068.1 16S rRNA (uracil(1498)-N(3))-methyltransferase [Sulfitobacter sp. S190]